MKSVIIAVLIVVPFVLFIAAALVYQSQTGIDIVTGEKTGLAAKEVGQKQFESIYKNEPMQSNQDFDSHRCIGESKCISQKITEIIDGDTIYTANYKIRLSLVDTPEKNESGFYEAKLFTAQMCPVGSFVTIDQDDLQLFDQYDRLLANVFCNGKSLNSALLYNGHAEISTKYCSISEFSNYPWAQRFGCAITESSLIQTQSDCTLGWYITGYFLPIETDYTGETMGISVNGVKQNYLKDFVKVVKIEGWGRTNAGNYLGWYNDAFTISDTYLDFHENDLIVGTIAVDSSVIEQNSKLTIPTLPEPWNNIVFSASDVGPSIIGKHIDVFTGEGRNAEKETFRITSENNKVCMKR